MAAIEQDLLTREPAPFSSVEDAVAAVARGEIVVVVDDPGRENEGDFVMAAELVTPEAVNFMVTHGRGIVCMPIMPDRAHELGLTLLPRSPADNQGCAWRASCRRSLPTSQALYGRTWTWRAARRRVTNHGRSRHASIK